MKNLKAEKSKEFRANLCHGIEWIPLCRKDNPDRKGFPPVTCLNDKDLYGYWR